MWELSNERGLSRLIGLSAQIETIAIAPDGSRAAALAQNWEVGIWDLRSGHLECLLNVPPGDFQDNAGLAFSTDGRTLAYSASNTTAGTAVLYDAATGRVLNRWPLSPGLQNHFGFDGPNLWHFQVETASGHALPTTNLPWSEHPRVGRIRNLTSPRPEQIAAEIRDFPRHVFTAKITPDGRHTVLEGNGETRSIAMYENATGRRTVSIPSANTANSSPLFIDATGTWAYCDEGPAGLRRRAIPDGGIVGKFTSPRANAHAGTGDSCSLIHGSRTGCKLFGGDRTDPVVDLAFNVPVNVAQFDRSGQLLLWGGRDGRVVMCRIDSIRQRLQELGLGW